MPIVVHVVATTPEGDIRQIRNAIWDHFDAHQGPPEVGELLDIVVPPQ